ncbi:MAG TPA: Na/Pi cotransporter family protein [Acidimicrobiia bacterium]|jgi:phosphate:Na+ symporter|nr:Na/Pi cotransporter family protein [Acidimicrobiia bacterium]
MILATAASEAASTDIDTLVLVTTLFGGLAIFLLGMDRMTESLRLVAGSRLRTVLAKLTSNRFTGLLTGAGVTAVIQSSSVTTVLVVGFISSGLMTLEQAISVIVGANVGTTITAQIIAFEVETLALAAVAIGFGVTFFSKRLDRQAQGNVVMGLGLVFFGMTLMGDAMSPLRSSETFIDLMARLENPFLGILVGAAFTALVQSSSATTGIVIVLAQQGLITLDTGIALVLGANVGTSITALLAALGKPRDAMRAAVAHTLFNVGGVLIWLPFLNLLSNTMADLGGGTAREIANAHTTFNVANALIFIWFVPQMAALVTRLVPDRGGEGPTVKAKYLDPELLRTPALALDRARQELRRMGNRVSGMLDAVLPAILSGTRWTLLEIAQMDDEVDDLHAQIIEYLGEVSRRSLAEDLTSELLALMEATNDLEAIGDIIETNLVGLGLARVEQGLEVSEQTQSVLVEFHSAVSEALDEAVDAVAELDARAGKSVGKMKRDINALEEAAAAHQAERLIDDAPDRVANYRLEIDVVANLKRVFYFAKRMARTAAPRDSELAL